MAQDRSERLLESLFVMEAAFEGLSRVEIETVWRASGVLHGFSPASASQVAAIASALNGGDNHPAPDSIESKPPVDSITETVDMVRENGAVTISDAAKKLGLTAGGARLRLENARLAKKLDRARRDDGQYAYSAV